MSNGISIILSRRESLCSGLLILLLLYVQFLNKPVHIDDANFLRLAEGAARDFRRPHLIPINWLGETVPAFDVLSNPPGIAWWLAPTLGTPVWFQHLWMLLWLFPTAWGARELGRAFCHDDGESCVWVLLTCPVVVLSAQSFLPDLPLLACTIAGLGGVSRNQGRYEFWAFVAGMSFLFRYSGCLVVIPLLLIAWKQTRVRGVMRCWPVVLPAIALAVNDFLVYGKWHLLAMFAFQNDGQHKTLETMCHNFVAAIAMLGGAGLLPVLVWQRGAGLAALAGALIGFNAAVLSEQNVTQMVPTVIFTAAGFAALFLIVGTRSRDLSLSTWASLGLVLVGISRFAATRYWVPFLPAFVLLGLRNRRDAKSVSLAVAANLLVSLGLSIDDYEFAEVERQAAIHVASLADSGQFSGHWGWQHYLEAGGWNSVEPNQPIQGLVAVSRVADPQPFGDHSCLRQVSSFSLPDRWPGPRTHSHSARASYHAGGKGAYAPWALTNEPYDTISVFKSCEK